MFILGVCQVICSCNNEYSNDKLFPEEYHKIMYFKNEGKHIFNWQASENMVEEPLLVIKAGSDPSLAATVNVRALTQQEIDESYSQPENQSYKAITSDAYSFKNGVQELTFAANETSKYLYLNFDIAKIYQLVKSAPESKLVLALQLESTEEGIVNLEMNRILYVFNINGQQVEWEKNDIQIESVTYSAMSVKLKAEIVDNISNFSCGLDFSQNAQLVSAYNDFHSTNYEPLPSGAYNVNDFSFTNGNDNAATTLTVTSTALQKDKEYLLPLKFAAPSSPQIEVSDDIYYLTVVVPADPQVIPDNREWKILLCNSDQKMENPSSTDGDNVGAGAIIDGIFDNHWHSSYWGKDINGFSNKDDYHYGFTDYHGFDGMRTPITIVIDMKNSIDVSDIGLTQRRDNLNIKKIDFYVSDDPQFLFKTIADGGTAADYSEVALNNWTLLFSEDNAPRQNETIWFGNSKTITPQKGRFLKVVISGAYNEPYRLNDVDYIVVGMAELQVKQLSTMIGKIIQ